MYLLVFFLCLFICFFLISKTNEKQISSLKNSQIRVDEE